MEILYVKYSIRVFPPLQVKVKRLVSEFFCVKVENLPIPKHLKEDYISSGITDLNPPQELAVDSGLLEGDDMIVASPTASGKTFIAELAMVNQVIQEEKTAVYIVPLKALAAEKYQDFSERYSDLNVMMSVGDKDETGEYLETADIVIVTSEKLDSMLRHNPSWIHEIGLVVIDEIHLLTSPNRGPTLEVTLTRLRDLLEFQLLGLSATISNSNELAEWLNAELVESDYRPVRLKEGIHQQNSVEFFPEDFEKDKEDEDEGLGGFKTGSQIKEEDKEPDNIEEMFVEDKHGRATQNILQDTIDMEKQCIIFCSSRKGAEKSSDRCAKVAEEDLSRQEKQELERIADDIENALGNPTSQCKRLAKNVRKGSAFHHAGLCLSGDSKIIHSDGSFSRMDELVGNSKKTALGLSDYILTDNKIKEKYEMGKKPVLNVKTGTGRELRVSKNHQLPTLGKNGINWVKSKNLSENDRIAVPRKIDIETQTPNLRELLRDDVRTYRKYSEIDELVEKIETDSLEQDFRERYREDRNISVKGLREICDKVDVDPCLYLNKVMSKAGQKHLNVPEELDKDLAWVIGAVAGDGYIGSSEVYLSGSEDRILERFREVSEEKFDRNVSVNERNDGVKKFKINSKAISDILHDYFGIPRKKKASNLKMPEKGMPDNLLASYIRGLFDTDGSVNCRENSDGASCIEFYTASEQLIQELHVSLLRFGINAHRDKRDTEGRETKIGGNVVSTNGDIHRLSIYGSDQLRKFQEDIGFTHPKKKAKLKEAIEINPEGGRNQNDVIPTTLGSEIRKIRNEKDLSLSDLEPEVSKSTASRFENQKTPMKRNTFQKLAEKLDNKKLKKIADSEIYWDKITKIEQKDSEKLYDISTSTENFIANGIIAHNTTEQRELVEKGFKEGLIRSVSATPTLAAGINLPAFRVVLRDLKRYTGDGMDFIPVLEYEQMCLPYDQKIVLETGERKKIGEIVENEIEENVLSVNNGEIESKSITEFFSRESEILEIETETGRMKLTENHPVKTDSGWRDAGELTEGDLLNLTGDCINSQDPYFYKLVPEESYVKEAGNIIAKFKKEFELTDKEVAERLNISESSIYHYKNNLKACSLSGILTAFRKLEMSDSEIADEIDLVKSKYGNVIDIPKKLSEEFMWLLGIVLTDGNLNRTTDKRTGSTYKSIRVFNTNENIIETAKSAFKSLGLDCYEEEREEGKYRLEVGNSLLAQMMNEVFDIPYGAKSQNTKIPEIIFSLPKNLQSSFIEGVFDGDGSYYENREEYKRRIHFSSSSKRFINDLRELLANHKIKSRIDSKFVDTVNFEQEYEVKKTSYALKVRNKDSVNKMAELMNPVKTDISGDEYSTYNNSNNQRKEAAEYTEVLNIDRKGVEKVYNVEVEDNHNYVTGSRTLLHNCGRAGRPKYDDSGEAISLAKNPGMRDEILDRYILGEAERIQSKLAAEPILRMHTLSLIASNFCNTMEQLLEFYRKTFYAYQYGSMDEVDEKVKDVVKQLQEYDFLERDDFAATKIGKRVSELYIDPDSAHMMIECLEKAVEKDTKPVSYLFMLSQTTEMQPSPRVRDKEWSEIEQALMDAEQYLLESVPEEWDTDYDRFMESMKNTLLMQAWIAELDEEKIMNKYNVAPGGIRAKMQDADWLIYGAKELARMKFSKEDDEKFSNVEKDLEKLRLRLQHGIKEELLNLVSYDQIGRVRARKLYDHGIRDQEEIREVNFEKLKKLIGKKTGKKLKKQVGEENIFDRENVMDYFD